MAGDRIERRQIRREAIRFLQVGLAGFVTDVFALWLLIYGVGFGETDFGLIWTRLVAYVAAVTVTFLLNARYTFGARVRDSSLLGYLLVQMIGAAVNLGAYSLLVLAGPLAERPLYCLVVGSALGTVCNFVLVRKFVFPS